MAGFFGAAQRCRTVYLLSAGALFCWAAPYSSMKGVMHMDTQTVIAVCAMMSVFLRIIDIHEK